jgi:hypothetical protein
MKMGDKAIVEVETISSVFRPLGVGGYPRGRLLKYTVQNHLENYFDTSCYCRSSKKRVELLLMLNMHSIEIMLKN